MIPISVVTGFLGSGKTTLIGRMLRDPAFARTAVIVNEFGEIGLDHDLITVSDDQILTLSTGCLCCAVQSDLAATLMQLHQRREAGSAVYDRVLIETSGLADPVPVLQSLMTDAGVAATYQVPVVITLVDAIHGEETLQHHPEARHQVVLADKLLISKTDLRPVPERLSTELAALNPSATRMTTLQASAAAMFDTVAISALVERLADGRIAGGRLAQERLAPGHRPLHASDIETFVLTRDRPMPALALTLLLQAVAEHCGSRLLRLKGLVAIEEMPGQPAVIHGVRHVVSSPDFLARWPSEDASTRIVFITRRVPRHFIQRLLDAIETEVRDVMAH